MAEVVVNSERVVAADPDRVFAFLCDYRTEHPRIFPPNFSDYRVEEGGVGNGTVISFTFKAGSRERACRMRITTEDTVRRIIESDANSTLMTTYMLTGSDGGAKTRVQLRTTWQGAKGVGGFFERTFAPPALRRIYNALLQRLDDAVSAVPRT